MQTVFTTFSTSGNTRVYKTSSFKFVLVHTTHLLLTVKINNLQLPHYEKLLWCIHMTMYITWDKMYNKYHESIQNLTLQVKSSSNHSVNSRALQLSFTKSHNSKTEYQLLSYVIDMLKKKLFLNYRFFPMKKAQLAFLPKSYTKWTNGSQFQWIQRLILKDSSSDSSPSSKILISTLQFKVTEVLDLQSQPKGPSRLI